MKLIDSKIEEVNFITNFKEYKYSPKHKFSGCFNQTTNGVEDIV